MDAIKSAMQWVKGFGAIATIALAASCSQNPAKKHERADTSALQVKATAACECDLAKGKDCWTDYRASTKAFRPQNDDAVGEVATSCAPVSSTLDCMKDGTERFCIVKGYFVNGVELPNRHICRPEEAKAIDDAFNAVIRKAGRGGDWDHKEAADAAREALAAIRAGRVANASSSSRGCV
ncbi:hypothetical protein [Sphingopyxis sp. H115]|uniref:hypothetical protein n=1 Tax=Sphingopyxis sp. H115 TaxID=1759073 RepID=UPI000A91C640|nr:hypothetical protein [Sphingopyxis sp. H115]